MLVFEPSPTLLGVLLLLAVHLCAVLTGLGAFPLAWFCEVRSKASNKIFNKKLAQQLSALGLIFLCYTIIAISGSAVVLATRYSDLIRPWLDAPVLAIPAGAALLWLTIAAFAYAFTWRSSKNNPTVHSILGLFATLGALMVLACSLSIKLVAVGGVPTPVDTSMLQTLMLSGVSSPFFLPLLLWAFFSSLACAGGIGLLYLLIRRNRDDFGRDYYIFSVGHIAKVATVTALGAIAAQAWTFVLLQKVQIVDIPAQTVQWLALGSLAAIALALVLWIVVWRSKVPVRRKPAILLAALLLLLSLAGSWAINALVFLPGA